MSSADSVRRAIQAGFSAAQASLVRRLRSIDEAEDAMQEAVLRALRHWPERGIPPQPVAWLIVTGTNYYRDQCRREARIDRSIDLSQDSHSESRSDNNLLDDEYASGDEDVLRLIFMCCHPSIAVENQLALSLKMLMGFSPAEIAKALLISERTLEQRITRAKRKIASSGISFELPRTDLLSLRLGSVRQTLYLIFNEGYYSIGEDLINKELCRQAIQLTRALCRSFPESENFGLLALMLFHDARANARVTDDGELILLDAQNRMLWKRSQIDEADVLLQKALRRAEIGSYQLQAAIAGLHSLAEAPEQTDWQQIVGLYRRLLREQASSVVRLNYAVALIMVESLSDAESLLTSMREELAGYSPYYAALAKLYSLTGREEEAARALKTASELSGSPRERRHYQLQLVAIERNED